MAFSDGLYINAIPKKHDLPNDTALISDRPKLSAALKEVAALRKQFLSYFTEGTFIGESVLSEPACDFVPNPGCSSDWVGGASVELGPFKFPPVFIRGHQLKNKLLIIVLNNQDSPRAITFESNLEMWIAGARQCQVKSYNSRGTLTTTTTVQASAWEGCTGTLQPLELALLEVEAAP
jgi:hypothetical protein